MDLTEEDIRVLKFAATTIVKLSEKLYGPKHESDRIGPRSLLVHRKMSDRLLEVAAKSENKT